MNPWIPDREKYFCNICCKRYVFWFMPLLNSPDGWSTYPQAFKLCDSFSRIKELYVHKTNGGFTRWLPWKMAAPKAYFFHGERGGWWMLGNRDFWARSSSPTGEIFSRYSSQPREAVTIRKGWRFSSTYHLFVSPAGSG